MKEAIEQSLTELEKYLQSDKPKGNAEIIEFLRQTPLPFLACYHEELSASLSFNYSFEFLHLLGQYQLPLALGLCMNQYIAQTIAIMPVEAGTALDTLKTQFLKIVLQNRWILAVSSFDDFIRNKNDAPHRVVCKKQQDGSVICNGIKNFQSNILNSDVLLFSGQFEDGSVGLFYTFVKNPSIHIGEPLLDGAMADTDTRSLHFEELRLESFQMIPSDNDAEGAAFHSLSRILFSVMAMAPYLGGAKRALDETCRFLQSVHINDAPLAELDGYQLELGRMFLKYQMAEDLIERFNQGLSNTTMEAFPAWMENELPRANVIKNQVPMICEELVSYARTTIGTRSMMSGHIISQLTQQILFATLHPDLNAKVERAMGRLRLGLPAV